MRKILKFLKRQNKDLSFLFVVRFNQTTSTFTIFIYNFFAMFIVIKKKKVLIFCFLILKFYFYLCLIFKGMVLIL